jgi:hypothetical protein
MALTLSASNWSPAAASGYITLSWNRAGYILAANQSISATITLTVAASVTGVSTFNNTITITGTA